MALLCVLGKKRYNPLVTVHCQEELLSYSSLLVGAGMWADMIYYAETRRHLGKLRYPGLYDLLSALTKSVILPGSLEVCRSQGRCLSFGNI